MVDIPRIKFFAQRRYRANWPFMDGRLLIPLNGCAGQILHFIKEILDGEWLLQYIVKIAVLQ